MLPDEVKNIPVDDVTRDRTHGEKLLKNFKSYKKAALVRSKSCPKENVKKRT
jgi:hypothetical protein